MSQFNQIIERFQFEIGQLHLEFEQEIKDNYASDSISQREYDEAKNIFEQEIKEITSGFIKIVISIISKDINTTMS